MLGRFQSQKALQASAIILKETDARRMSTLRLLKLLYLADREMLKAAGRTITGDRVVAMKNGPVLSRTYSLLKGEDYCSPGWDQYIRRSGRREVEIFEDPGIGELSASEIRKLKAVVDQWDHLDDWELVEELHQLPEWKKNRPDGGATKANPISLDDLLEAVGMSGFRDDLVRDAGASEAIDSLLESTV